MSRMLTKGMNQNILSKLIHISLSVKMLIMRPVSTSTLTDPIFSYKAVNKDMCLWIFEPSNEELTNKAKRKGEVYNFNTAT
jgi:hypothetical protein